jgi:hypothetical protein
MRADSVTNYAGDVVRFCQKCVACVRRRRAARRRRSALLGPATRRAAIAACATRPSVIRVCRGRMAGPVLARAEAPLAPRPSRAARRRCNRLQPLADFEGGRHTCAAALASHNARRRRSRRSPDATAAAAAAAAAAIAAAPGAAAAAAATAATSLGGSAGVEGGASGDGGGGGSGMGTSGGTGGEGYYDDKYEYDDADEGLLSLAAGGVADVCEWLGVYAPGALTAGAAAEAAAAAAAAQLAAQHAAQHATLAATTAAAAQAAAAANAAAAAAAAAAVSPVMMVVRSAAAGAGGASALASSHSDLAAAIAAATAAAALHGCTVHVKLPGAASPLALPAAALRAALGMSADGDAWAALSGFGVGDSSGSGASGGSGSSALLFPHAVAPPTGAVRPGCVLLSLDALCEAGGAGAGAAPRDAAGAAGALRAALAAHGGGDAALDAPALRGALLLAGGVAAPLHATAGAAAGEAVAAAAPLAAPRVRPCAALLPADNDDETLLTFELVSYDDGAAGGAATLHARLGGRTLRCAVQAAAGAGAATLTLRGIAPRRGGAAEEGAALLEAQRATPRGDGRASLASLAISPPAAALLCRDAAVVAQACATGDALLGAADAGADAEAHAALSCLLRVAGEALSPRATRRVRCAAAAASVWLGWDALLTRLLRADDGAVLLCAAAHVLEARRAPSGGGAAPRRGSSAACAAAVAAAAARAWPRGACAAACAALRQESPADAEDGTHPACAAEAALARLLQRSGGGGVDDGAAAALLCSLLDLLDAAPMEGDGDADDSDAAAAAVTVADAADAAEAAAVAAAAAQPAASEAAYMTYLARINTTTWLAVSALSLMNTCSHLFTAVRYVLLAPRAGGVMTAHVGATNGALIDNTLLLPVGGGAAFPATDVPFDVVVAHVRLYAVGLLLLRLPGHAALAYHAVRMARTRRVHARYERLFFFFMLLDSGFYLYIDLLVLHATGAIVQWHVWPAVIHAAGMVVTHLQGPFRAHFTIASVTFRLFIFWCAFAYAGGLRMVLRDPGCLVTFSAVAFTVWRAPTLDRDMRAAHAAQLREEAARAAAAHLKAE